MVIIRVETKTIQEKCSEVFEIYFWWMKSFSEAELWHIKFFLLLPIAIGISLQVLVRARWYFKTTFTFALRAFRCNQGYGSFAWRNKVALHSVYLLKQLIMKVILD